MSPKLMQVERAAFRLPPREREVLARKLMESLEDRALTEVDEAWVREAERRHEAFQKDRRRGGPAKAAIRQIRRSL